MLQKRDFPQKRTARAGPRRVRSRWMVYGALLGVLFGATYPIPIASAFYNVAMFWKRPGFTFSWPFTAGTDSQYTFGSSVELVGGVARLKKTDQVDDDNTATGYAGGTLSGVAWDTTNSELRLTQTGTPTNTAELDASWTPNYSSILGYWRLNGSGSIANNAAIPAVVGTPGVVNNPNGTGMSYSAGKLNQGIIFDAVDDQIVLSNPGISFTNDSFTVTGWFKANAASTGRIGIFATVQWDASYNNLMYTSVFIDASNNFQFESSDTNAVYMTVLSSENFRDGNWHHFAAIRDKAASSAAVYVDARLLKSLADTRTGNFNLASSPSVAIIGTDSVNTFSGQLDEITVWNGALSAADLTKLYDRQSAKYSGSFTSRVMDALATGMSWTTLSWKTTLPFLKELPDYSGGAIQNETTTNYTALANSTLMSGIVGLWHLDEASGTTGSGSVKDGSGQGNNGTPKSTMSFGSTGILGNAPVFDGTATGAIEVPDSTALQFDATHSFSMQAWIKTRVGSAGSNAKILVKRPTSDSTHAYALQLNSNKYAMLEVRGGSAGDVSDNVDLRDGNWHQIIAVIDRGAGRNYLYVDGVLKNSASFTADLTNTGPLGIGNWTNQGSDFREEFNGSIDEVAIWSRALSATEVLQLYRRGTNRIKYQVRVCTASDCSDDATGAHWKGPDGTNQTYFSELDNMSSQSATPSGTVLPTPPSMLFSNFTSPVGTARYFQYRTILESDDAGTGCNYGSGATWCSPELKSVTVDPTHYDSAAPSILGVNGVKYFFLNAFVETLGASCASGIGYNLGVGASSATATWYWWDSTANAGAGGWAAANGTVSKSNPASVVAAHASAFGPTAGAGTVYFKAYLKSSGTSVCELDQLDVAGGG